MICYDYELDKINQDLVVQAIQKYLNEKKSKESLPKQSINMIKSQVNGIQNVAKEKSFWESTANVLDEKTLEAW